MHTVTGVAMGIFYWNFGNEALNITYNTALLNMSLLLVAFGSAAPTAVTCMCNNSQISNSSKLNSFLHFRSSDGKKGVDT